LGSLRLFSVLLNLHARACRGACTDKGDISVIISSLRPELSSGGMVHHAQQIETIAMWQKMAKW